MTVSPILNVLLSVVSGVITAAVLYGLKVQFQRVVVPWFRGLSYDGIRVEGVWFAHLDPEHQNRTIKIELTQDASTLTGLSVHVARSAEGPGDRIRAYKLTGRIHDRFVSLTGELTDHKRLGDLHYLLELSHDGQVMKGSVMAYSTFENQIVVHACTATRQEAMESSGTPAKQIHPANAQSLTPVATG